MLWRWAGARVAPGVRIVSTARFVLIGELSIGQDTYIGHECLVIGGDASVEIGSNADVGPRVTLSTGSHAIDPIGGRAAGEGFSRPIRIGNGTWIGASVTILGDVSVGECAVIGAGSLVIKNVPSRCVVGGVPARELKGRLDADDFNANNDPRV